MRKWWTFLAALTAIACAPSVNAAKQDYCQHSDKSTVVIIDRTQPFDSIDRTTLLQGLGKVFDTLEAGEHVTLRTITDSYTSSENLFDACYPGCPEQGLLGSLIGSCSSMRARGDRTRFQQQLVKTSKSLLTTKQAYVHSDILLTIASIAESMSASGKQPNRYIIYSDLLENSQSMPWPKIMKAENEELSALISKAGLNADFSGASLQLFGVGRLHYKGRPALKPEQRGHLTNLWSSTLKNAKAKQVRISQSME